MLDYFYSVALNYLLILLCIVLFIAPFFWAYRVNHLRSTSLKENPNLQLEHFFSSKHTNWLVFFWAMGEALVWFVIPEFLLILLIFMRIRKKRQLLLFDIYGTIAGTLLAFLIHLPEKMIDKLPYVQPSMVAQTREWFDSLGIFGLIHQPFSGVPYKVFTYLAANYDYSIVLFVTFAVIVRISRYYLIYLILSGIYPFLHKFVYRNYIRMFLIAVFVFTVLLLKVYYSYGNFQP